MKLLRYADPGREKPALRASDGSIRGLSDIAGDTLSPASIARLSVLDSAMSRAPCGLVSRIALFIKPMPGDVVAPGATDLGTQRQTILGPDSGGHNLHRGSKR